VLTTGTASGKSLAFQVPIIESATRPIRSGRSLVITPTKALAQDQLRSLVSLAPEVAACTYDGDSTQPERTWARANAEVIFTNPEMLHYGVLPNHRRWEIWLRRLDYLVIDELHAFKGVFGSHVANVLRRLLRLCAHYGSQPTLIATSATVGAPLELARSMTGVEMELVDADGAPDGGRVTAICDPGRWDRTVGSSKASAEVAAQLMRAGVRTLVFCRSRAGTERLAADLRRRLPRQLRGGVRSYRGGYLADERRSIEIDMAEGTAIGVVTTTALELGIDLGDLDAVVMDGFPGTIASFRQQAGRAGRRDQPGLAVLVRGNDQLDRWFTEHPDELQERQAERAVVNPANPHVLLPHVRCAANERPLHRKDDQWWPNLDDAVRELVLDDSLTIRRPGSVRPLALWAGNGWPSSQVGLRSSSGGEIRIVDPHERLVGTVGAEAAPRQVYPGAIYLHRGGQWRVVDFDPGQRRALVEPCDLAVTTQVRSRSRLSVLSTESTTEVGQIRNHLGMVEVVGQVTGYVEKDASSWRTLEEVELELEPTRLITTATWCELPEEFLADRAGLSARRRPGALHALEHAAIGLLPLFAVCDRWDVGGVSTDLLDATGTPSVVIYDGQAGGSGIAQLAHSVAAAHLAATLESVASCACAEGCPSCVVSPKCGNGNEPLDKQGAIATLSAIAGKPG